MSSRPRHFVLSQPGPLRLYSTAELLTLPPPTWQIDQIIPAGGFIALVGQPGAGKSFIALDMAMSVAAGGFWQGHAVKQDYVLYVSAEGGTGVGKRAQAWLQTRGLRAADVELAWMIEPVYVRPGSEGMQTLLDRLDRELLQKPGLIVLDTLARCLEGDKENQQEDMGRFVAGVDTLRHTYQATVLVVHHMRKDGDVERGSSSFRGAADTMLLAKRPSKTSPITFSCTKQKDAEEFPEMQFRLKIVPELDSCVITSPRTPQKEQHLQAVLYLLQENGPLTWDAWRELVSSNGTTKTTFFRCFTELKKSGEIVKENGVWAVN